jgi:cob(I)alamin adenosyltransferase
MAPNDIAEIKEDLKEIKREIVDIKVDLATHMSRTEYNEKRIESMEEFAKSALTTQQQNFKDMLQAGKDNQAAMNKQLKIALGVFAALAALVAAVVPIISAFVH